MLQYKFKVGIGLYSLKNFNDVCSIRVPFFVVK